MGHKFSLVLSRQITDEESVILQDAGFADATFATDSLPTNADVAVTKIDFDDAAAPSLAEAIESALETVKKVPDLTVPGLTVPAVPQSPADDSRVVVGEVVEKPAAEAPEKKAPAKKAPAKKRSTKKADAANEA
ncbi:hypothetical protein [Streptomyces cellostaticus]|uniref:hypothetical protein n=1 Tax=Streptomyces cellostaticus TaxID=67285 RepID=UPI00099F1CC4|nr:hypothetical protein [Streptomyces cellostaticus]